jgi:hypothetical protein
MEEEMAGLPAEDDQSCDYAAESPQYSIRETENAPALAKQKKDSTSFIF